MPNQKTTGKLPPPRKMPVGTSFGVPHIELYQSTRRLLRHLETATTEAENYSAEVLKNLGVPRPRLDTAETELFSMCVQVFAAFTAEAALNVYGTVRFGERAFEQHLRWQPPLERLRRMALGATGIDLQADHELIEVTTRLFAPRNDIVHARGGESDPQTGENRRIKDVHIDTGIPNGRAAVSDLDLFFRLFRELDPDSTMIMHPW